MVNTELQVASTLGRHNTNLTASINRLVQANSSRDLSTICILPTSGEIHAKVVQNWMAHLTQMNQKFVRLPIVTKYKYDAFNNAIQGILTTPGLKDFKYILIMEETSMPPYDGLIKLYENIETFDVVGGLLWDKGPGGKAKIYGSPYLMPQTFLPVIPYPETIQNCLGLSTGFTLFKLSIFEDTRIQKPWFLPNIENPDLYFFENIHKLGYKVACDTRVKVGSYDIERDIVW